MEIKLSIFAAGQELAVQNKFMGACDVFEQGKRMATYEELVVTGQPNIETLCENFAKAVEAGGGYALFVGIASIDGQKPESPNYWLKHGVQTLCINQRGKWGSILFKDALATIGFRAETDERMHVTKIGH